MDVQIIVRKQEWFWGLINYFGYHHIGKNVGMGVDEKALISTLGNSHKDHRKLFRKASKSFFVEDEERAFEKCHDQFVKHLKLEFSRFNVSFFNHLHLSFSGFSIYINILLLYILVFVLAKVITITSIIWWKVYYYLNLFSFFLS